jgi:hypothetical protein
MLYLYDPRYKLRAEENVVHDSFSWGVVHHDIGSSFEVRHQVMVLIAACEARLMPSKLMPRAHLGDGQGNHDPMMDTMENNLPSTHWYILEAVHQQVTLGF